MALQEKDIVIIDKAELYSNKNLKVHIKIIPSGSKNGFIISELQEEKYFWFIDDRYPDRESRLFISEIKDIDEFNKGDRK